MADYDKEIPFGDGVENRGVDDDDEIEMRNLDPYDSSSRRGSDDTTYRSSHSKTYGETSFIEGIDEHTPLLGKEEEEKRAKALAIKFQEKNRQRAAEILKSKFPKWDPKNSSFNATLNEKSEVEVMLSDSRKAVPHVIMDADGNVNEREIKKSKKIQKSLGPRAEDIVETNREEMTRRENKI